MSIIKEDSLASLEDYKKVLKTDIQNEEALKGLGSQLFNLHKYTDALRCFQALEKISASESARTWIYACLIRLGKSKEAGELAKEWNDKNERLKKEGILLDYY